MSGEPRWRFSADSLDLEQRFGYADQVWPETARCLDLRPGRRLLDVGCGGGGLTRFLAAALGEGEVVGLDHDEHLLDQARKIGSPRGAAIRYEKGDAGKLPFPDARFDAVVSAFLLCVVPDPRAMLHEMKRVTKPGGLVASLSCFCKTGIFPVFEGLHRFEGAAELEALRRRFLDVRRTHVRNPALGLFDPRTAAGARPFGGWDLDVWGHYGLAGFEDLRIQGFLTVFAPGDARWSDAEARDYVEGRRRIELAMLDDMGAAQRETMARHGFGPREHAELRRLLAVKYEWLLASDERIRKGMEIVTDPAVLIVGRVPR